MKQNSDALLKELSDLTQDHIERVKNLATLSKDKLNQKTSSSSWSALECMEHLNLYAEFYNPEFTNRINASNHTPSKIYSSGLIGEYFVKSMISPKKMKTFADKDPAKSKVPLSAITRQIEYLRELFNLLKQAEKVSLNRTKVSITLSKWVKFRLGDILRVVVYHNQRHIDQAYRAVSI